LYLNDIGAELHPGYHTRMAAWTVGTDRLPVRGGERFNFSRIAILKKSRDHDKLREIQVRAH